MFPVRPGLCNIGVGMVTETLVRNGLSLRDFYAKFQRFVHHLGRSQGVTTTIGPHRGAPFTAMVEPGGTISSGDCSSARRGVSSIPSTARGSRSPWKSAHVAARTIRAAFQRGLFSEAMLSRYDADWHARFDPDLGISQSGRHHNPQPGPRGPPAHAVPGDEPDGPLGRALCQRHGGILGGVVPAREGVTPEMFVRALAHGPDFWRRVLRAEAPRGLSDWLRDGANLMRWQASVGQAIIKDVAWYRAWVREVESERRVGMQALSRALGA